MSMRKKRIRFMVGILFPASLLFSLSCATANWPLVSKQMISQGEKAINEAKGRNASVYAPEELKAAEEKLALAKKEFDTGWHNNASRLAQEAAVEAEYARAKATSDKDKNTVKEMQANIETLRREIERQTK